jgi:prolyl oligopeptidase
MKYLFVFLLLLPVRGLCQMRIDNTKWLVHLESLASQDFHLVFTNDSLLILGQNGLALESMSFSVNADSLLIRKVSGKVPCDKGSEGMYKIKWQGNGERFSLEKIYDQCLFRSSLISEMKVIANASAATEMDLAIAKTLVVKEMNPTAKVVNVSSAQPKAPSQPVTETYFGRKIIDPYRNLENLKDSAVLKWMKAQSDYARSVLNSIGGRQHVIDMMKDFDKRKSERVTNLVITNNNIYFYLKTSLGDQTAKLYTRNGFDGQETLLFDPDQYSKDTTKKYTISTFPANGICPSDDGSLVACTIAPNGSGNSVLLVINVKEKKLLPEQIDRCLWNVVSWLPDNSAFFFNRLRSSDSRDKEWLKNSKAYLHKVGTDPSADKEIFSAVKYPELGIEPDDGPFVMYDRESRYLFGFAFSVDRRLKVFYAPISEMNNSSINWKRLFEREDEVQWFNVTDKDLYIYTTKNAPHFKILKTSLQTPDLAHADVLVPEDPEAVITSFTLTSEGLYYAVTKNGVEASLYYLPYGAKQASRLKLPFAAGSISLSTKTKASFDESMAGFRSPELWVTISGWTSDSKRYHYLLDKNEFKFESVGTTASYPEFADLAVEEVMVTSHDGVKVPLSLIYKRSIKRDGNNPVMVLGYGAYGNSISPIFSVVFLSWTQMGGVMAIAHVRGGGELGENWHLGGFKTTKPNTWKDLISCADYLVNQKYTSPEKLGIVGGSAGGILIGRAMTERPDLFAVAIPYVGVMNPMRIEEFSNGPGNEAEFGRPKDSTECMALMEMDSYLHLKKGGRYPATLVTAGMNDPFVAAWQPAKFAARLQHDNASNKPILFWTDYEAGHGVIGVTRSKAIESWADFYSFALWQMGHPDFQVINQKGKPF